MKELKRFLPPPPVLAVPLSGTVIRGPDNETIGVLVGFGWAANDDKTPTMRPTIQLLLQNGAVVSAPAEIANVVSNLVVTS